MERQSPLKFHTWPTRAIKGLWSYHTLKGIRHVGEFSYSHHYEQRSVVFITTLGEILRQTSFLFGEFFCLCTTLPFTEDAYSAFPEMKISKAVDAVLLDSERIALRLLGVTTFEGAAALCCLEGLFDFMQRLSINPGRVSELKKCVHTLARMPARIYSANKRLPVVGVAPAYDEVGVQLRQSLFSLRNAIRQELLYRARLWAEEFEGGTRSDVVVEGEITHECQGSDILRVAPSMPEGDLDIQET